MKDQRKEKIKELKDQIKTTQEGLLKKINEVDLEKELSKSEEDRTKSSQEFKNEVEVGKVHIDNLKEALKQTRDNKYSSSFFEFIPSSPNRQMRRLAVKNKLKPM